MVTWLRTNLTLVSIGVFELLLAAFRFPLARASGLNALVLLGQVLAIVPAVVVLVSLVDAWLPRSLVETHLGPGSKARGVALAILFGTCAAGPLYAAYPIGLSLKEKGARTANIAIFLGAWGTLKIPMLLLESTYVGLRFALIRLALTLPGVIGVGLLTEWLVGYNPMAPSKRLTESSLGDH